MGCLDGACEGLLEGELEIGSLFGDCVGALLGNCVGFLEGIMDGSTDVEGESELTEGCKLTLGKLENEGNWLGTLVSDGN